MQGCVDLTQSETGVYRNEKTGMCYDAKRLPLVRCGKERGHLAHFQLPVAVSLLLRFLLEASLVLLLMWCLAIPTMLNNIERSGVRNECRELTGQALQQAACPNRTEMGSGEMPSKGPGGSRRASEVDLDWFESNCGDPCAPWASELRLSVEAIPVSFEDCAGSPLILRRFCLPSIATECPLVASSQSYLQPSRGSCEEYNSNTNDTQIDPLYCITGSCIDPFVDANSAYCRDSEDREIFEWLSSVGGTALFLLFLLRLRRLQRVEARTYDQDWLTASDYAAVVTGLPRGLRDTVRRGRRADMSTEQATEHARLQSELGSGLVARLEGPTGIEAQLLLDLKALGFSETDVVHIEVGRDCAREVALLDTISALKVQQHEFETRLRLQVEESMSRASQAASRKSQAALGSALAQPAGDVEGSTGSGAEDRVSTPSASQPKLPKLERKLAAVKQKLVKAQSELQALETAEHVSTGSAVVSFMTQHHMHRFVELCYTPPWWARLLERCGVHLTTELHYEDFDVMHDRIERMNDLMKHRFTTRDTDLDEGFEHASPPKTADKGVAPSLAAEMGQPPAGLGAQSSGRSSGRSSGLELPPAPASAPSHVAVSDVFVQLSKRRSFYQFTKSAWSLAYEETKARCTRPIELKQTALLCKCHVQNAPEPSAINWVNMMFTPRQRRTAVALTVFCVLIIILVDCAFIIFLKSLTRTATFEAHFDDENAQGIIAILISLLIVTINFCIKLVCRVLTKHERWITADDHDLSMFNKLVVAYLLNNIAVPIIVFSIPLGINQSWFESGGAVQSAAILIIADAASYFLRVLQIPPILRRLLAPLLARSQSKANQLWAAEPMFVGELYANALKTVTICLVYSPLWPPAYMLSAIGVLVAYVCFSIAISYWWRPPAAIGDELMQRLRTTLALMLLLRFAVEAWTYSLSTSVGRDPNAQAGLRPKEIGERGSGNPFNSSFPWARLVTNVVLLLVYTIAPVDVFTRFFRRYRHQEIEADMGDIRYEEVHAWLGVAPASQPPPGSGWEDSDGRSGCGAAAAASPMPAGERPMPAASDGSGFVIRRVEGLQITVASRSRSLAADTTLPFEMIGPAEAIGQLDHKTRGSSMISPMAAVTIPADHRESVGIPEAAEYFAFAHPLNLEGVEFDELVAAASVEDKETGEAYAPAWLDFVLVGGYCYFDRAKNFLAGNALSAGDGHASHHVGRLNLQGPIAASKEAGHALQAEGRMVAVTVPALTLVGFTAFAWVNPSESPGGQPLGLRDGITIENGGFVYEAPERDQWFVYRLSLPGDPPLPQSSLAEAGTEASAIKQSAALDSALRGSLATLATTLKTAFVRRRVAAPKVAKPKMQAYECPALSRARGHDAAALWKRHELGQATWVLAETDGGFSAAAADEGRCLSCAAGDERRELPQRPAGIHLHAGSDDALLERIHASAAHSAPGHRKLQNKRGFAERHAQTRREQTRRARAASRPRRSFPLPTTGANVEAAGEAGGEAACEASGEAGGEAAAPTSLRVAGKGTLFASIEVVSSAAQDEHASAAGEHAAILAISSTSDSFHSARSVSPFLDSMGVSVMPSRHSSSDVEKV